MKLNGRFTLYSFVDGDRSGRVRWTAHELGIAFDEQRVEVGKHREPEYLALNPFGRIPAIVVEGEALFESAAICTWLAEQRPAAGLIVPPEAEQRATFLQWMFLASSTLEDAIYRFYFNKEPEQRELDRLAFLLESVERHLGGVEYVVADRFTLIDILLGYVLELCRSKGRIDDFPNIKSYLGRLAGRPAAISAGLFRVDDPA